MMYTMRAEMHKHVFNKNYIKHLLTGGFSNGKEHQNYSTEKVRPGRG